MKTAQQRQEEYRNSLDSEFEKIDYDLELAIKNPKSTKEELLVLMHKWFASATETEDVIEMERQVFDGYQEDERIGEEITALAFFSRGLELARNVNDAWLMWDDFDKRAEIAFAKMLSFAKDKEDVRGILNRLCSDCWIGLEVENIFKLIFDRARELPERTENFEEEIN